jgi:hypothetical protein
MNKVYALGVMQIDLSDSPNNQTIKHSRLWALCDSFEYAEKCILENRGDIFEYYYNVALIEEIGLVSENADQKQLLYSPPKQWWYRADYGNNIERNPIVRSMDAPSAMHGICNFWVG